MYLRKAYDGIENNTESRGIGEEAYYKIFLLCFPMWIMNNSRQTAKIIFKDQVNIRVNINETS